MKPIKLDGVKIRNEKFGERTRAEAMIRRAFWDVYKPGCDEHYLTHNLRLDPAYIPELTRIAIYGGEIIGAVYYATSKIVDGDKSYDVITFGPLAVEPKYQRCGIGRELLRISLNRARRLGYRAVVIFGEPDYYPRIGFRRAAEFGILTPEGKTLDALMAYELRKDSLKDKRGRFELADVYLKIASEDLEQYDKLFR